MQVAEYYFHSPLHSVEKRRPFMSIAHLMEAVELIRQNIAIKQKQKMCLIIQVFVIIFQYLFTFFSDDVNKY